MNAYTEPQIVGWKQQHLRRAQLSGSAPDGPSGRLSRLLRSVTSWLRRYWWLPLLVLAAWALYQWWTTPPTLASSVLAGSRGPGCLRLVIAEDTSGSMAHLAAPRSQAVSETARWAASNLRHDDELAVVEFAGDAAVVSPPTAIGAPFTRNSVALDSTDTQLAPMVSALAELPATNCGTGLVILGDGRFGDLPSDPDQARSQLTAAHVDWLALLVPGSTDVEPRWTQVYPYAPPDSFDGSDVNETSLTVGRHIAEMTGQTLERKH